MMFALNSGICSNWVLCSHYFTRVKTANKIEGQLAKWPNIGRASTSLSDLHNARLIIIKVIREEREGEKERERERERERKGKLE